MNMNLLKIFLIVCLIIMILLLGTTSSKKPDECVDSITYDSQRDEFAYYYKTWEMEDILEDINSSYSNITELYTLGITDHYSLPIRCLEISDNPGVDEGEPGIVFTGLTHANEWPTGSICLSIAENLTKKYDTDPDVKYLVDNTRLWIVPCVNPDGYKYSRDILGWPTGLLWRKNMRDNDNDNKFDWDFDGVDLNRNFGGSCNANILGAWGSIVSGNCSHHPGNDSYFGPSPFSEKETQAIASLFIDNDICASINWHTSGEFVCWPWSYSTDTTPDNSYYKYVGEQIAARIPQLDNTGHYGAKQSSGITGNINDWSYGYGHYVQGRPTFSYVIEAYFRPLPRLLKSELYDICADNYKGASYLLQEAENISKNVPPRVLPPVIDDMTYDQDGDYQISWQEQNPDKRHKGRFWVETPDDIEDDKKIWLYYGNNKVNTTSDGEKTFIWYEGFDGNSYNTSRWQVYHEDGSTHITVADGIMSQISDSATHAYFYFNQTNDYNISCPGSKKFVVKIQTTYDLDYYPYWATMPYLQWITKDVADTDYIMMHYRTEDDDHYRTTNRLNGSTGGADNDISSSDIITNQWHWFNWYVDPDEPYLKSQVLKADRTELGNVVRTAPYYGDFDNIYFLSFMRPYTSGKSVSIDYIYVAKWENSTQPSWDSFGSGEEQSGSSENWWNSDWSYRKLINISNAINGYQMGIDIGYSTGGNVSCGGFCQLDFDDIRFIDYDNNTELDYWLEEYTPPVHFQLDELKNHSYTIDDVENGKRDLKWSYSTNDRVRSSPSFANGKVYVGSNDKKIYCLNADNGSHIWNYTTDDSVYSSPAVADGKVYVGSHDDKIYCLNADNGSHIWNYTTSGNVWPSPAVAEGKVYIGGLDYKVYCLDADTGSYIWNYTTDSYVHSSPTVVDGRVYIGSYDKKIYCLDADNGSHIWNYTTRGGVWSSPAIADGKVYAGSDDDKIYCIDADNGNFIWSYKTDSDVRSSPAVADSKVYFGSRDRDVYCLDAKGNGEGTTDLIWNYTTGGDVRSSPAVAEGKIYIGSWDEKVYCLNADNGEHIWSYKTDNDVHSSPAVADGMVYVGSEDGKIYCLFGTRFWYFDGFDVSNERKHSGDYSFKSHFSGHNKVSAMTTINPIPITEGMDLSFWCWYDIQDLRDYAFVEVSKEGRYYKILDKFIGFSDVWKYKSYSLDDYVNESIFIRFRYTTDYQIQYAGFYVDDIMPISDFGSFSTISTSIFDNQSSLTERTYGEYYYRVRGFNSERGWGDFSTLKKMIVNKHPNIPFNPRPPNGTTVEFYTDLNWNCSDPDGYPLTYDVFFGTSNPPPLVSSNQSTNTYYPGTLDLDQTYYWKIIAFDNYNASTSGPIWEFKTDGIQPEWRNQGQNKIYVMPGENISLFAESRDNVALNWACLASNETGNWQNYSKYWMYRKEIIIDHTKVDDYLSNFPVLISNISSDFVNHAQIDGDDFLFTDKDGLKLNHEIEKYDVTIGELIAWVNVTSLNSTEDTILYLYYGNPLCSNQQNVEGTWDSDFIMVHHLNETSGDHLDSTSYNNDLIVQSITEQGIATGIVGKCDDFERANTDYLTFIDIENSNIYTFEAWAKYESVVDYEEIVLSYRWIAPDGLHLVSYADGSVYFNGLYTSSDEVTTGVWYHFVGTGDGADIELFLNKVSKGTNSITSNFGEHGWIGTNADLNYWFDGLIDEIRGSKMVRSNAWINTTYNTISSPETFITVGTEEIIGDKQYGSPIEMEKNNEWQWSNFTWQNSSIPNGTNVGWRIYYIDTSGNVNCTDIMSFEISGELYVKDLQSEWNCISIPFNQSVNKTDLIIKYNGYNYSWQESVDNKIVLNFIYEWNRSSQNYELVDSLHPGFGYWIYTYDDCELWAQGMTGFIADNFITDLHINWNSMGLPDDENVHKENLIVYYNETENTWQEAVNNNIILNFIYLWNETTQNYEITDSLIPGKACWMYAYVDCRLLKPI